MGRPEIMRHRDFNLYWSGVVLSEVGTRGTFAAILYHVYDLSGSTLQTGLVGLAQAIALLLLSPLGGAIADRMDRRRLLQVTQVVSLLISGWLATVTMLGIVEVWQILLAVLLNTSAATFERPARDALIPALVPRTELVHAFALLNPSREVAILIGPAIAGGLIALGGPQLMYLVDVASYAVLVVVLLVLRTPAPPERDRSERLHRSIEEGARFLWGRPIIVQFMALDLAATVFGAYRVLLPAIATDLLMVGAVGYGVLGSAPSAGALVGSAVIYRIVHRRGSGKIILGSLAGYGLMNIFLVWAGVLPGTAALIAAFGAAMGIGFFDALATTIRHAAVQLETPDAIRGRVTALYLMTSRSGPALGDLNIGWLAGMLGPVGALTLGGMIPVLTAGITAVRSPSLRGYQVVLRREHD